MSKSVGREITFNRAVRLQNTRAGNPRYVIHAEDGRAWETEGDAACNHEVSAIREGDRLKVWISQNGFICGIDNYSANDRVAGQIEQK